VYPKIIDIPPNMVELAKGAERESVSFQATYSTEVQF